MLLNNRVIFNDNAVLSDLSISLSNVFATSETLAIVAAQDCLYIGSELPFNHRYFLVSTANDQASVVSAYIWNGSEWVAAVDVLDQTVSPSASGKTLSQSGIISWQTDRNYGWAVADSTELMTGSGLTSLKIYKMYWVKLTFSGNLKATTAIKYIGHKFSTDSDLGGYYPDLTRSSVMTSFQSGKTNWDEQTILAAEEILRDLKNLNRVWSKNQVFGFDEFADASVHKVAEIIFSAFGSDAEEKRILARDKYEEALKKISFANDKNADGHIELKEKSPNYGRLIRI